MVGLAGGLILFFSERWARFVSTYAIAFAAGVLITVSLIDLLPEAAHLIGEDAYLYVLFAFLAGFLLEQWFEHFHQDDHERAGKSKNAKKDKSSFVPLIVLGDTIHNFIDGVTIAAAFLANPGLGLTVAISTLLHEIPHEIGDFGIMLNAGYSKTKVILINFISALATFIGVGLVLVFSDQAAGMLGIFLAIAAGMFIYIAGTDLLPRVTMTDTHRLPKIIVVFLGVLVMLSIGGLVPHSHESLEDVHEHETHYHEK